MFIASKKKKENIAEYLLYMWQIEDIIRAYKLDIDKIQVEIIDKYQYDDSKKKELREWYESLIHMMRDEGVTKKGHLQINKNIIIELTELHLSLLKNVKYPHYGSEFFNVLPYIVELRSKSGDEKTGEIETCFNALYGLLMLRLQSKEISESTMKALTNITKFIALLSNYYINGVEDDSNE